MVVGRLGVSWSNDVLCGLVSQASAHIYACIHITMHIDYMQCVYIYIYTDVFSVCVNV